MPLVVALSYYLTVARGLTAGQRWTPLLSAPVFLAIYGISGSVFATVAMHATYNTAFSLMPYYGSTYHPLDMSVATVAAGSLLLLGTAISHRRESATGSQA